MQAKSDIDISIVIVSWNTREILRNCLNSIRETASEMRLETWVVDNASSDGSAEMVAEAFPEVHLIRNDENLGFARGNNIGIGKTTGRYVCLINSDVILRPGCLQRCLDFAESRQEAGLMGPRILSADGTLQKTCQYLPGVWRTLCDVLWLDVLFPGTRMFSSQYMNAFAHDEVRCVEVLTGCFWLVRRKAMDRVGLLDEGFYIYGEDIDWCKRFADKGWEIAFFPDAEAIHLGGASSANAPMKFFFEMQKADMRYWEKHYGRWGRLFYASSLTVHHALRSMVRAVQYVVGRGNTCNARFKMYRSFLCMLWLLGIASEESCVHYAEKIGCSRIPTIPAAQK